MYQPNLTSNNNLGLLPSPSFEGSNRKRPRESIFPQPTYKYELPSNDMVPVHFLPPPAPTTPSVRLGFNAYEQQAGQKRVCYNDSNPAIHPAYGYGGVGYGADHFQNDLYKQPNPTDHYNPPHPNFFASNTPTNVYPITSIQNQSMISPYNNTVPQISSHSCSSGFPGSYPYHVKENVDPNISRSSLPVIKMPHNFPSPHKAVLPQVKTEPIPDNKDHQLTRGLQLITVNPDAISRWVPLLARYNILFEVFGCFVEQPTSFFLTGNETKDSGAKMFYVKSPHSKPASVQENSLKCVYWEIESSIVSTQLGKVYRIIGSYDTRNSYLKSFDIRAAKIDEVNNWAVLVARSNRLLRKMQISLQEA